MRSIAFTLAMLGLVPCTFITIFVFGFGGMGAKNPNNAEVVVTAIMFVLAVCGPFVARRWPRCGAVTMLTTAGLLVWLLRNEGTIMAIVLITFPQVGGALLALIAPSPSRTPA